MSQSWSVNLSRKLTNKNERDEFTDFYTIAGSQLYPKFMAQIPL